MFMVNSFTGIYKKRAILSLTPRFTMPTTHTFKKGNPFPSTFRKKNQRVNETIKIKKTPIY